MRRTSNTAVGHRLKSRAKAPRSVSDTPLRAAEVGRCATLTLLGATRYPATPAPTQRHAARRYATPPSGIVNQVHCLRGVLVLLGVVPGWRPPSASPTKIPHSQSEMGQRGVGGLCLARHRVATTGIATFRTVAALAGGRVAVTLPPSRYDSVAPPTWTCVACCAGLTVGCPTIVAHFELTQRSSNRRGPS